VCRTVHRFEDLGEDGLLGRRAHRPPRKVTTEVEARLVSQVDSSPQDFGWQRTTWTLIAATYVWRGKQLVVLTPGKNVKRYVAGVLNTRTGQVVHVTRNHRHRTIEPLMESVDGFIQGAQPFPGTKVSMVGHAA
jgi:hypothetical protein